ncbi:general transcription factor 3C polypeptide [Trifolium repens]|nr:general transcription factor 3C polypeptide [Trifolium repens]
MDVIEQNQEEDPTMAMEEGDNAIDDFEDDGENEENASENEEEVEEEKDTEDEDEFMFREGTNPLDLVHNNDSGVQLYQRSLDHQALPNKKRKAPERCNCEGTSSKKARGDDISGVCLADLVEVMDFEPEKRSKKTRSKKRSRQKGSKTKLDEKLSQMLGDANLHYANRRYDMAISVLHEVVRLKPNLPESYHILGLVYRAIGNYEKEMISTLITAYLTQKDSSLWERLFEWSIEQGDIGKANCYISKAITADPKNSRFRIYLARLLAENQDYQNAAAAYEQVYQLCRENVDALKAAAKFYHKCGQVDRSICILEDYLKSTPDGVNATVVDLLGSILMEIKAHDRALLYIEQFQVVGEELPLNLKVKAGICHVHLGNMEMAQVFFNDLKSENASKHVELITEVADSLMGHGHYNSALNYFKMFEGNSKKENGLLYLKIARCYQSLEERKQGIIYFYKALETLEDDVEARISLASLLVEEGKENEAISLLSPPKNSDSGEAHSEKSNRWWVDVRIKLKLCNIFQIRGMLNDFVNVSLPLVRESLRVATPRPQKPNPESPLCNLHKDEEYQLIIDLCNALASLLRYREALVIINLTPRTSLSAEKNQKLQSLGTQMAYNTTDPKQGFECVKSNVQQHAQSVAAWNSYFKVISRLENRDTRHVKFLHNMQGNSVDCVPPILISAHQSTLYSHHQDAARKYLEVYKRLPEIPLVNLCVGTALINLALGFRLKNKHQCVVQGLAFLYNNLKICGNSQESLFNIARAYHHVGLVTLVAIYYEKVIAINERDYPIPKFPNENIDVIENHKPGYCNLRREAAYNLHLIYKRSGALDLARQVLKDYCSV